MNGDAADDYYYTKSMQYRGLRDRVRSATFLWLISWVYVTFSALDGIGGGRWIDLGGYKKTDRLALTRHPHQLTKPNSNIHPQNIPFRNQPLSPNHLFLSLPPALTATKIHHPAPPAKMLPPPPHRPSPPPRPRPPLTLPPNHLLRHLQKILHRHLRRHHPRPRGRPRRRPIPLPRPRHPRLLRRAPRSPLGRHGPFTPERNRFQPSRRRRIRFARHLDHPIRRLQSQILDVENRVFELHDHQPRGDLHRAELFRARVGQKSLGGHSGAGSHIHGPRRAIGVESAGAEPAGRAAGADVWGRVDRVGECDV